MERESGLSAQLLQSGGAHVRRTAASTRTNQTHDRLTATVVRVAAGVVVVFRLRSWLDDDDDDDDDVRCRSTTRGLSLRSTAPKRKEKKRVEQTEHKWR